VVRIKIMRQDSQSETISMLITSSSSCYHAVDVCQDSDHVQFKPLTMKNDAGQPQPTPISGFSVQLRTRLVNVLPLAQDPQIITLSPFQIHELCDRPDSPVNSIECCSKMLSFWVVFAWLATMDGDK
jgi:hypothetical protein